MPAGIRLRVQHGQAVYLLECRIPTIAKRNCTRSGDNYYQLLQELKILEQTNEEFIVTTSWHSRITGIIAVTSGTNLRLRVHHTDVVRV